MCCLFSGDKFINPIVGVYTVYLLQEFLIKAGMTITNIRPWHTKCQETKSTGGTRRFSWCLVIRERDSETHRSNILSHATRLFSGNKNTLLWDSKFVITKIVIISIWICIGVTPSQLQSFICHCYRGRDPVCIFFTCTHIIYHLSYIIYHLSYIITSVWKL